MRVERKRGVRLVKDVKKTGVRLLERGKKSGYGLVSF